MDFENMTSDQVHDYAGPVYNGTLTYLWDDGKTMGSSDHCSTSEDGLKRKMLGEARIRRAWQMRFGPNMIRASDGTTTIMETATPVSGG